MTNTYVDDTTYLRDSIEGVLTIAAIRTTMLSARIRRGRDKWVTLCVCRRGLRLWHATWLVLTLTFCPDPVTSRPRKYRPSPHRTGQFIVTLMYKRFSTAALSKVDYNILFVSV